MPTLKEIRKYRRMSRKELEEKAGVGRTTLGRHERGTQKPLFPTIRKYATALAVDEEDIDFPQWPEDYISNLEIPSEIKGSNENQFETEDGSLLNEDEIEANEILITDPRIVNQLELTPKPIGKPQPQPGPGSSPTVDTPQITLPGEAGLIKRKDNVPGKGEQGVPTLLPIRFPGTISWQAMIPLGTLIGFTSFLFGKGVFGRWDAGRGETTSPSKEPVKPSEDDMLESFKGHL